MTDTIEGTNKKSKKNISLFKVITTLGILAIVSIIVIVAIIKQGRETYISSTAISPVTEQVGVEAYNINVAIIKEYIKQRNKTIPIEVCQVIAEKIITLCEKEKLPSDLVVAMIETESTWNPTVTSSEGAKGLMQILIEDGIDINPKQSYDIEYNIETGIAILKSKLNKSNGNLTKALKMYVGGCKNYSEKVYQAIGMFVMYKSKLIIEEQQEDIKKEDK